MITKHIRLSGHSVHAAFLEPQKLTDENTCLVFLHEALGSIGQWRDFPQLLCNALGMRGFVYERQGHGLSDPFSSPRKPDYLHRYAWEELPELIGILVPAGKKAILVGHSDGGTIALLYAAHFPKMVAGVVTMAAHVLAEPETLSGIHPAVEAYRNGKLDGLRKYHGDQTETLFFAWADTWLSPGFRDWNISEEIAGISCPALIMQGREDQYGTPLQVDLIIEKLEDAKGMILEKCRHHPHLEQPKEVIALIAEWRSGSRI